jgi:ribosome-binding protein aMBF1 (putative translation factor)
LTVFIDGTAFRETLMKVGLIARAFRTVKSKSLAGSAELRAMLGQNIRRLRRELGWSQARLAAEAALGTTMIGKLEAGRANPRVVTLAALANALGVLPADLLAGSSA